MDIKFVTTKTQLLNTIIIGVSEELNFDSLVQQLNPEISSTVNCILKQGNFKGKKGESLNLGVKIANDITTIVLIGMGPQKELNSNKRLAIGGHCYNTVNSLKIKEASLIIDTNDSSATVEIASGIMLRSYKFDKYYTKETKENKHYLTKIELLVKEATDATKEFTQAQILTKAVFLTRDLVSEPPNILYPATMAAKCKELEELGIEVEILGESELQKLGMGALLGVGQGSSKESKMVVMQWRGLPKSDKSNPLAFVGKGVTFDTGGISIKPATGMENMKYDMAGAGAVIGTMKALAGRKAKVNAVGVIGLVENMPGGNAIRPSDVLTSASGQTIAVLNTDAEGRLVLADCLWYCQDRFKPKFMVNLATLTGAIIMTFGSVYAGLFSNCNELSEQLTKAGIKTGEKLWRLPMDEIYNKTMNSEIADIQNISNDKGAGSITAAQFLERFVNKTTWAHLDIAGVAWASKDEDITPKGATAFGVRLLNQFVLDNYEA